MLSGIEIFIFFFLLVSDHLNPLLTIRVAYTVLLILFK